MKKLMVGVVIGIIIIVGCTNPPPGEFWEPTSDDTLAVTTLLSTVKSDYGDSLGFLSAPEDFVAPNPGDSIGSSFYSKTDPFIIFNRVVFPTSIDFEINVDSTVDSLLFAKDSTCLVYVFQYFSGKYTVNYDSITPYVKDTVIVNETLPMYGKIVGGSVVFGFDASSGSFEKELKGNTWQAFFFEMDSTGEWHYSKKSGAIYYFPNSTDAPNIYWINTTIKPDGTPQDFYWRPPDTTESYKYGIFHLYSDEEIRSFSTSDTMHFDDILIYPTPADPFINFIQLGENRITYGVESKDMNFVAGSDYFYVYTITNKPLVFANNKEFKDPSGHFQAEGEFNGLIWSIPIKVE